MHPSDSPTNGGPSTAATTDPFVVIAAFVHDLNDSFGSKHQSVLLYDRLLQSVDALPAMRQKHIQTVRAFCVANRDAIYTCDFNHLHPGKITHSDRVYIPIKQILAQTAKPNRVAIWTHLLTLSALLDADSKALAVLQTDGPVAEFSAASIHTTTASSSFMESLETLKDRVFGDLLSEWNQHMVQSNVPATQPLAIVNEFFTSGIAVRFMQRIQDRIQDGEIDLAKLSSECLTNIDKLVPMDNPLAQMLLPTLMGNLGNLH